LRRRIYICHLFPPFVSKTRKNISMLLILTGIEEEERAFWGHSNVVDNKIYNI